MTLLVYIKAQNECKKEASGSERCFIFAKKRKIVWNSINYKFPKDISELKQLSKVIDKFVSYRCLRYFKDSTATMNAANIIRL